LTGCKIEDVGINEQCERHPQSNILSSGFTDAIDRRGRRTDVWPTAIDFGTKHIKKAWSVLTIAVDGLKNLALLFLRQMTVFDGVSENVPLIAVMAVLRWRCLLCCWWLLDQVLNQPIQVTFN